MSTFAHLHDAVTAIGLLMFCFLVVGVEAADLPDQKQLEFFERQIRPVFVEHCYECHLGDSETKRKGGLNLSFREGLLRGGDNGPVIVPGKPEKSILIKALRYESYEMPPKGKLPDLVVEDFVKWIEMGAPDPRTGTTNVSAASPASADHSELWSLQLLSKVEPPQIEGVNLLPIDRFVRARLLNEGVPSAPAADPRILLRRMHFDLTGLPPNPDDLARFDRAVAEDREAAVEDVVGRLLDSAEFGECWARHWLDLTAYADTIGVGRPIVALEAWRYRDYVIDSFNADKPFDEFIRQQIAGDIVIPPTPETPAGPPPTAEGIIATGFLAIGPWELVNGDKVQLRMDVIDKQVHRLGQAFLGMTFGCARCHDHKFDPVAQRDYYALAGLFKSTVTLNGRIGGVFSAVNHQTLPETSAELLARVDRIRAYEEEVTSVTTSRDDANSRLATLKKQLESATEEERAELEQQRDEIEAENQGNEARLQELKWLKSHRTEARALAVMDAPEPEECRINIRGNAHQLAELVPRGFPESIAPKDKQDLTRGSSGRVQLAEWLANDRNPLTARVWVNRAWSHLFGAGLVRTVDNFGARGEKPSHPELLDYLAAEFMRDGWSTKRLIRRILLSQTWQQACTNPQAIGRGIQQTDPDNRLLWRANRRRLEAEAVRDAMLAVSGQLDYERGGPTLPVDEPGNLNTDLVLSLNSGAVLSEGLRARRSVYQPQRRKSPFDEIDILAAFDLPDPSQETGQRAVTTVPTQALALLNSPFAKQCATATARRFMDDATDPQTRIQNIYLATYSRAPSAAEERDALELISTLQTSSGTGGVSDTEAWSRLCQSLMISNEFLFRD
jgi:hypothetical protein